MKRQRILVVALATAALLGLAACSSTPQSAPTAKAADLATGVPGGPPAHLNVGTFPIAEYGILYATQAKGYFSQQNLDVTLVPFTSGPLAQTALQQGQLDILPQGTARPFTVQAQGVDTVITTTISTLGDLAIVAGNNTKVPKGDWSGLKGKTIGVQALGASSQLGLELDAPEHGLKASDLNFVAVGAPTSAVAALKQGQVDFLATTRITATTAIDEGFGTQWYSFGGSNVATLPDISISAMKPWADSHKAVFKRFLTAIDEGLQLRHDDPAYVAQVAYNDAFQKAYSVATLTKVYSGDAGWSRNGSMSAADVTKLGAGLVSAGLIPKDVPASTIMWRP